MESRNKHFKVNRTRLKTLAYYKTLVNFIGRIKITLNLIVKAAKRMKKIESN